MSDKEDPLPFRMAPPRDMNEDPQTDSRRVAGAANGLIIVAALAIILNCLGGYALRTVFSSTNGAADAPEKADDLSYAQLGQESAPFLEACVTLLIYPLALFGGIQMKQLKSYGLAYTSAILVMLPCSVAFPVGFVIGIWALGVLNNSKVKETFR